MRKVRCLGGRKTSYYLLVKLIQVFRFYKRRCKIRNINLIKFFIGRISWIQKEGRGIATLIKGVVEFYTTCDEYKVTQYQGAGVYTSLKAFSRGINPSGTDLHLPAGCQAGWPDMIRGKTDKALILFSSPQPSPAGEGATSSYNSFLNWSIFFRIWYLPSNSR